jgi:twinkle protein
MTMGQLSEKHLHWLTDERKLDPEIVIRAGVYTGRWDKEAGRGVADPRGTLMVFPFVDAGQVVNEKIRAPGKKFWQWPSARATFLDADVLDDPALIAGDAPLVIVEGEIDKFSFETAGVPFVVSVPDGAPPPRRPGEAPEPVDPATEAAGKFEFMWNNRERLARIKRFVIAVDGDPAGQRLAEELVRRLGAGRCWFVSYPEGAKDANEVLIAHGPERVADLVARARPYPVKGVYRLADYPDLPEPETFSTGWPGFDDYCRLWLGEVMIVTGIPGHGKSSIVLALCENLAEVHGWRSGIASFEIPTVPYLRGKLRRLHLRKAEWSLEERWDADAWINRQFVFFDYDPDGDDDAEDITLEWLLEKATDAVRRHGIRVLVIDPWNELEHARRRDETEHQYIGRAIRMLKRWAKRNQCVVIVVAHPTKDVGKDGKSRVPSLYDIEGSSHWFNKPDHGLVVDNPNDAHQEARLFMRKVRFENTGKKGVYTLQRDPVSGRFDDPGPGFLPLWRAAENAAADEARARRNGEGR